MNAEIRAAIIKLKADAAGVVFTGFVTNADVESHAGLTGEIWAHVCADGFGTFGDGHRIVTSTIVQIHSSRDSLWVGTESGSTYGILSFAPLGWIFFSDFHQTRNRLDPLPPDSPAFRMARKRDEFPKLAKMLGERPVPESALPGRKILKRELRGPEENTKYKDQMDVFVQETIETFERIGVKIPRQE